MLKRPPATGVAPRRETPTKPLKTVDLLTAGLINLFIHFISPRPESYLIVFYLFAMYTNKAADFAAALKEKIHMGETNKPTRAITPADDAGRHACPQDQPHTRSPRGT